MAHQHMQIGEVAHRAGLSQRTIRYYEELRLVVPARTEGGFRLYTDDDVARLQLIKRMKSLEFSLDETKDLLVTLDALAAATEGHARASLVAHMEDCLDEARARVAAVRGQLAVAEGFATDLSAEIARHRRGSPPGSRLEAVGGTEGAR